MDGTPQNMESLHRDRAEAEAMAEVQDVWLGSELSTEHARANVDIIDIMAPPPSLSLGGVWWALVLMLVLVLLCSQRWRIPLSSRTFHRSSPTRTSSKTTSTTTRQSGQLVHNSRLFSKFACRSNGASP